MTAYPISGVTEQPPVRSGNGGELVLNIISLSSTVSPSRYRDALSLYSESSSNEFSQSFNLPVINYNEKSYAHDIFCVYSSLRSVSTWMCTCLPCSHLSNRFLRRTSSEHKAFFWRYANIWSTTREILFRQVRETTQNKAQKKTLKKEKILRRFWILDTTKNK